MNTTEKGSLVEVLAIAEFIKRGIKVLTPVGGGLRYDFVLDVGCFIKVQCKHARLKGSALVFKACSSNYMKGKGRGLIRKSYHGEIDWFVVYNKDLDKFYIVPIEDATKTDVYLRLSETKQGQVKGIRWAKKYELEYFLQRFLEAPKNATGQ